MKESKDKATLWRGLKEERPHLLSNFSPRLSRVCVWPRCQEVVLLEDEVSGKISITKGG